jgi:superfamily II DNA/RNA helicase
MIELFKREPFIGEPFFQSAFGWEQITPGTNWKASFEPVVAQMIEDLGTRNHTQAWSPYIHQHESWTILNDSTPGHAQSVVVTSGTGSGKTECFLYPVLNDLYKHSEEGIQAIFMYPLNALANDQKGRIEKCCSKLGLHFACYNGNTKYAGQYRPAFTEIDTRTAIREHRPDLLMTNPSMLEYILVRYDDKDIMKPNNPVQQGSSLRWIIIDEAHTYTGSAAVELKYEIKRVIEAFGAKMSDIHFACTSATIGSDQGTLQQFIHELTGQDINRIHVIGGQRIVPAIPASFSLQSNLTAKGVNLGISDILTLRREINDNPYLSASDIWNIIFKGRPYRQEEIPLLLETLDGLCEVSWKNGNADEYLLMLRAHYFMKEPGGLYTCLNPSCTHHGDSPMGFITGIDRQTCPHCGAPLFELFQCRSCQEFVYKAEEDSVSHELSTVRDSISEEVDNIFADDEDDDTTQASPNPIVAGGSVTYKASLSSSKASFSHLTPIYHNLDFSGKKPKRIPANAGNAKYVTYLNDSRSECCAHCGQVASSNRVSGFHLPMDTLKQLVSPVLLAETTPNAGQFWGKYISFTDSRQKTAISAKKFNINVERDYALSAILGRLSEDRLYHGSIRPLPLTDFKDVVYSQDIFEHIATDLFSRESYKAAVLRSAIGRRLLLASGSLETMGLVSVEYPDLRRKQLPNVIVVWNNNNPGKPCIDQKDWADFLKICLDYVVRLGNCIQPLNRQFAPDEKNYLRNNSPTTISAPGQGNGGKEWPSINRVNNRVINRQNRIVTLLCAVFGIDDVQSLDTPANIQLISGVLDAAWAQLTGLDGSIPILKSNNGGLSYYLDMSADDPYGTTCFLKLNEKSTVCPVTRKFLDVTFMSYSPMMNGQLARDNMEQYKCASSSVKMPVLDISHPNDGQIADWIQSNPEIKTLKGLGLWSNYMENAFRFRNVYVAAEHSAQLDRAILEEYTNQFKGTKGTNGRLNILNCSTTMEMGVDIGDIDLVFLANVPPEAANYLQRAGRAGRFGQSKATAFTTCPSTPEGMSTFFTPDRMLVDRTAKRMPKESAVIVDRHINSFFFRDFILAGGMAVAGDSSAADFFIKSGGPSVCDSFIAHLNGIGVQLNATFANLFPGQSDIVSAISKTRSKITEIRNNYIRVYTDLVNAYNAATTTAARVAISYQLDKFAEQNLLNYLSEMQFFPNASMPTGIVEFDAASRQQKEQISKTLAQIKALRAQLKTCQPGQVRKIREDLGKYREKLKVLRRETVVSREAKVALCEYAPGQTVVVNEKNYVSDSLALRNSYGAESINKWISRCDCCGWTEYSELRPNNQVRLCSKCGIGMMSSIGLVDAGNATFTLAKEVVGYAADYNADEDRQEEINNHFYNITTFLPNFLWNAPRQSGLCDVVGKDGEKIVYCNKGVGFGFAVQRASASGFSSKAVLDVAYTSIPNLSFKGLKWSARPPFSSPLVDRHVFLTCENTTSYAAMRFFSDSGRNRPLTSEAFLYSIGAILTRALCDYLAIDYNEIAFGINKIDTNFLYLYDTNKGGAGYSSQLADLSVLEGVIRRSYEIVSGFACDCKDHPGQACAKCLMTRGTYSYAGLLSTADVYLWLEKQMRQFRTVPSTIELSSPGCRCEPRLLQEVLEDAVSNNAIHEIDLFIPKENELLASDWNDRNSPVGTLLHKAQAQGKSVNLFIEYDKNDTDLTTLFILYNAATALSWLDSVSGAEFSGSIRSAIVLKDAAGIIQNYFTDEFDSIPLSNAWGTDCDTLYQDSVYPAFNILKLPDQNEIQKLLASGNRMVMDGEIIDGIYSTDGIFRDMIMNQVIKGNSQMIQGIQSILNGNHVDIQFTENYLVSPIACIILTGLIKEMKTRYNFIIDSISLNLDSSLCVNRNMNYPVREQYIRCNFDSQSDRDTYIKDLMTDELGVTPTIGVNSVDHHRWLRFTTKSGQYVEIRPDHGIGACWKNDTFKHKDLPGLSMPITFRKLVKYYEPEPTIVYYILFDKN